MDWTQPEGKRIVSATPNSSALDPPPSLYRRHQQLHHHQHDRLPHLRQTPPCESALRALIRQKHLGNRGHVGFRLRSWTPAPHGPPTPKPWPERHARRPSPRRRPVSSPQRETGALRGVSAVPRRGLIMLRISGSVVRLAYTAQGLSPPRKAISSTEARPKINAAGFWWGLSWLDQLLGRFPYIECFNNLHFFEQRWVHNNLGRHGA